MAKKRQSWLDDTTETPLIEQRARNLESFVGAMADGVVEAAEVAAQEKRVVGLMKEVEPMLDDDQHAKLTDLLCELTVYDLMQVLHTLHQSRPQTVFQG